MKRKIFYGVIFILGIALMVAREYERNNFNHLKLADDTISMEIKEGTLTNKGATVIITDKSKKKNIYDGGFLIYKKGIGRWLALPSKEQWVNAIGYRTDENGKLEFDCNWEWWYGKLKKGTYRLVKSVIIAEEWTEKNVYVEFEIK